MQSTVGDLVRQHFRDQAISFDSLYDAKGGDEGEGLLQKVMRPMLFLRRDFAAEVVRSYDAPRVLDIGCGSGRVAEVLLESGAASYVGVDFSEPMLGLAEKRLERFGDKVSLVSGDFLAAELEGPFDVVVALGFFDYIQDPTQFALRMSELCQGSAVASFPEWDWVKGPLRKVRYEVLNDCPIYNYTPRELDLMFRTAGFDEVTCTTRNAGILMRADKRSA